VGGVGGVATSSETVSLLQWGDDEVETTPALVSVTMLVILSEFVLVLSLSTATSSTSASIGDDS